MIGLAIALFFEAIGFKGREEAAAASVRRTARDADEAMDPQIAEKLRENDKFVARMVRNDEKIQRSHF